MIPFKGKKGGTMSELYENGTIITMEENCPEVEAVLTENGKIVKCGTKDELAAFKKEDTRVIDLKGKTMMPAFLDGHSHFTGFAMSLSQCDLSGAKDFDDIVRLMKEFIRENHIPEGSWVTGTNYDHNFLKEKKHPDKEVLNRISEKHPVVIVHASSHMGVANSMALREKKLDGNTKDPAGGKYGRVSGSSELNGYMEENAFVAFRNHMPMPKVEDIVKLLKKAQEIYASYGIATVQEGMVTEPLFQILQLAESRKLLYLDLVGYVDEENSRDLLLSHRDMTEGYHQHLKIGGYKIFLDGSPQGRTAWMKEPYEGAGDGYRGYPIKTDEQLYGLILNALKDGQQVIAHCNGDAAAEQYITQFEKVHRDYPDLDTERPVMIHAQLAEPFQMKRMKELSMMPSFFVAHTYYWGDIHIENFGRERAKNISAAGSAVRAGIPFTFHQDSPVLYPDMFKTVWCAVNRVTRKGVELSKEERTSVYDALKANTVNAAFQYGEEDIKGSIREGKNADFIILDRNPLKVPADEVKDVRVLKTIKDGNVIFERK